MRLTFAIAALAASVGVIGLHGASALEVRWELRHLIGEGRLDDLRWPNFSGDGSTVSNSLL